MIDQLEHYIAGMTGARLPPERQLARDWGVSRSEVRKALARLELEGRLVRKVGSGTFVKSAPTEGVPDVITLRRITSPRHAMEARLAVEPETARLAAVNATHDQIDEMMRLAREIQASPSWDTYKRLDKKLHELIATASGNGLLAVLQHLVDDVRAEVVWGQLDTNSPAPPADYSSFAEHDVIIDAIARHDRDSAAEAMRRHLLTTYTRLMG